jgi:2-keto-4-pentenoate hydratase/2-oxohepta-3-ene-1,7-dioic acid hydratase in catechol pathway
MVSACILIAGFGISCAQNTTTKYVRYESGGEESYGILEDGNVHELDGDFYDSPKKTGKTLPLSSVRLLAPGTPSKVIAIGLNYSSHLAGRPATEYPGMFAKYPTSIIAQNEDIIIPPGADNLHYEGELVVVIRKKAKNVTVEDAANYIFGVTAGNDVSERTWQQEDLQWLRAKASDTFAPVGPAVVSGLDYNDLLLETRLNGKTVQSERTSDLLFDISTIISYVSQYITLMPGDFIFTGTPGSTVAMKPGDVVEVEIEGVGILRNGVAATETMH